jgi:hypothetical protein
VQARTPAVPGKNAACTSAMNVLARVGKQRVNSDADACMLLPFVLFQRHLRDRDPIACGVQTSSHLGSCFSWERRRPRLHAFTFLFFPPLTCDKRPQRTQRLVARDRFSWERRRPRLHAFAILYFPHTNV